jgi:hypothetical protein
MDALAMTETAENRPYIMASEDNFVIRITGRAQRAWLARPNRLQ